MNTSLFEEKRLRAALRGDMSSQTLPSMPQSGLNGPPSMACLCIDRELHVRELEPDKGMRYNEDEEKSSNLVHIIERNPSALPPTSEIDFL